MNNDATNGVMQMMNSTTNQPNVNANDGVTRYLPSGSATIWFTTASWPLCSTVPSTSTGKMPVFTRCMSTPTVAGTYPVITRFTHGRSHRSTRLTTTDQPTRRICQRHDGRIRGCIVNANTIANPSRTHGRPRTKKPRYRTLTSTAPTIWASVTGSGSLAPFRSPFRIQPSAVLSTMRWV